MAYDGAPLALEARAWGGTAPYAYAWSLAGGDASRFSDPFAASTTLDTAGLSGDVVVSLTVTDAAGAAVADDARHVAAATTLVLDRTLPVAYGAPDERTGLASHDRRALPFVVPPGTQRIEATLDWGSPESDFDLELVAPSGQPVARAEEGKPLALAVDAPPAGPWRAHVAPVLAVADTFTARVRAFPPASIPLPRLEGPTTFGSLDDKLLTAGATGGAAPYAFAWDLDLDGRFEATGDAVVPDGAVGERAARVRVTDATGYEVERLLAFTVLDAEHILRFTCGGDPARGWAMEFTASKGSCWMHGGHHTYFMDEGALVLRGGAGRLFAVEQQFTPPPEAEAEPGKAVTTRMHAQTSLDGRAWTELDGARYVLVGLDTTVPSVPSRQAVRFTLPDAGEPFRFLRFHNPLSAAQGLSGYLDHSEFELHVDVAEGHAEPLVAPGARSLACERDILEDFFADHPCTFGGVNRYDAPSFFHTYPLGGVASLDRVSGELTLAPWRSDDWRIGKPLANATETHAFVQTSVDGVAWATVATVPARYGAAQPFDVPLEGHAARFVRLLPAYHAYYDDPTEPALHHPEGFFVHSRVDVEGLLPSP